MSEDLDLIRDPDPEDPFLQELNIRSPRWLELESRPEFSPPAEGEEVIIGLKTDGSRPKLLLKMLEEENEEVLTTGPPPPL